METASLFTLTGPPVAIRIGYEPTFDPSPIRIQNWPLVSPLIVMPTYLLLPIVPVAGNPGGRRYRDPSSFLAAGAMLSGNRKRTRKQDGGYGYGYSQGFHVYRPLSNRVDSTLRSMPVDREEIPAEQELRRALSYSWRWLRSWPHSAP